MNDCVINLANLTSKDLEDVGGKNASLGEMIQNLSSVGVLVPGGFATTSKAFQMFLQENNLKDNIDQRLSSLDVDDISALSKCGDEIRNLVLNAKLPESLEQDVRAAYKNLESATCPNAAVAVRSSATAEDLPEASFAGQQESYLNVCGIDEVLIAIRKVFASLYNDRAIAYRVHQGFEHAGVSLSAGVQQMVRSDLASSGVMFTLDTESGSREVVLITGSYGLGETIVQGQINPDEFYVSKAAR